VRSRALAWPLDERALDYEGIFEVLTVAPGLLATGALAGAAGVGIHRLRRPALRLRAGAVEAQAGGEPPTTAKDVEGMPFRGLTAAVAEREGWGDDEAAEPPAAYRWDPVLMAARIALWLPGLAVHLRVMDRFWVPTSPVIRATRSPDGSEHTLVGAKPCYPLVPAGGRGGP
jgi:hypothetical protein